MPQHQGNKRQGNDKPQGSGKQLRERFFLAKTKLCLNKTRCMFGPKCFFAHSLKELSPAPEGWTRSQTMLTWTALMRFPIGQAQRQWR